MYDGGYVRWGDWAVTSGDDGSGFLGATGGRKPSPSVGKSALRVWRARVCTCALSIILLGDVCALGISRCGEVCNEEVDWRRRGTIVFILPRTRRPEYEMASSTAVTHGRLLSIFCCVYKYIFFLLWSTRDCVYSASALLKNCYVFLDLRLQQRVKQLSSFRPWKVKKKEEEGVFQARSASLILARGIFFSFPVYVPFSFRELPRRCAVM